MKRWIMLAGCLASLAAFGQKELPVEFRVDGGGGRGCECTTGFPTWIAMQWTMATCGSGCRAGFSLGCGVVTVVHCSNGDKVVCPQSGSCPDGPALHRRMEATYTFYDNGMIRLRFSRPLPEDEPPGTFEIEEARTVRFPHGVFIGGRAVGGYTLAPGKYRIDLEDGRFGSVTLSATFLQ